MGANHIDADFRRYLCSKENSVLKKSNNILLAQIDRISTLQIIFHEKNAENDL